MDATPPLVDGDVEHRALDGDQPGVGDWALRLLQFFATRLNQPSITNGLP